MKKFLLKVFFLFHYIPILSSQVTGTYLMKEEANSYFGWKILIAHFAAALYNIGINAHVILFGGSFNRKKIDLSQRAAFNYQGTGAVQWLLGIPLLLAPMGIFSIFYFLINFEAGISAIAICGLLGIVFHQRLMKFITEKYLDSKYKMISAFGQDN